MDHRQTGQLQTTGRHLAAAAAASPNPDQTDQGRHTVLNSYARVALTGGGADFRTRMNSTRHVDRSATTLTLSLGPG